MPWSLYPWGRNFVPIEKEAGWDPQPGRTIFEDTESLALPGQNKKKILVLKTTSLRKQIVDVGFPLLFR
jgi:hypothetical protein